LFKTVILIPAGNLMKRECLAALAVLAALMGFGGCGQRLHPVGGQLIWADGQPATELAGAMVYFDSSQHGTISRSMVQADGRFQLTTHRPEASGPDGVPPGVHRVYVRGGSAPMVEQRFRDPATSGLVVTVPPNGPVVLQIARASTERPTPPLEQRALGQ
jgi:hypothetical protein